MIDKSTSVVVELFVQGGYAGSESIPNLEKQNKIKKQGYHILLVS